jgi:hypothetical protein
LLQRITNFGCGALERFPAGVNLFLPMGVP